MQVQSMGGSITLPGLRQTNNFQVPCATEVIVKLSSRGMRRGDYPCGCRLCREAAVAALRRPTNPLAAIDVFDLPHGITDDLAEYFH